jgi:outer membrane protein assembly factor BamB
MGAITFMGWDWSDTSKPPVEIWTTNGNDIPCVSAFQPAYGYGNIYVMDTDNWLYAIDALTGQKVYGVQCEAAPCGCTRANLAVAYGRLYFGTYTGAPTEHCYDAKTGKLLWWAKLAGQQTRGQIVMDGVVCFQEMGSYFWGLDAYDGHPIWKHLTQRHITLHSQNSAPTDQGPEGFGKTSIHV